MIWITTFYLNDISVNEILKNADNNLIKKIILLVDEKSTNMIFHPKITKIIHNCQTKIDILKLINSLVTNDICLISKPKIFGNELIKLLNWNLKNKLTTINGEVWVFIPKLSLGNISDIDRIFNSVENKELSDLFINDQSNSLTIEKHLYNVPITSVEEIGEKITSNPRLDVIIVSVWFNEELEKSLSNNSKLFDNITVVTISDDIECQKICNKYGSKVVITNRLYEGKDVFNKGKAINDGVNSLENPEWILLLDSDIIIPESLDVSKLDKQTIYWTKRKVNRNGRIRLETSIGLGYFQLFHISKFKDKNIYLERFPTILKSDIFFRKNFKKIEKLKFDVEHIGSVGVNWKGRKKPEVKLKNKTLIKSLNASYVDELSNSFMEYSIVIPTMWKSDKISIMLNVYEQSNFVKEVIIIDNNPANKIDLNRYTKIRYYTKGENIFVNPAWNWGYSLSNYNLILANDDIIIENFDSVMQLISNKSSSYDIIGVSLIKDYYNNEMKIIPVRDFPEKSYGCFMYIKNYIYVPDQLKIWYGDLIQFNFAKNRGILINSDLSTDKSTTINSDTSLFRNIIGKNDILEYKKLLNTQEKINVLIRTSNRPLYFYSCIQSIKKYLPNSKLHITIDDIKDLDYVEKYTEELDCCYYLIDKDIIYDICKKIPIERDLFIYNYYFNIIKPYLNGWCLFLDDDDELLMSPIFNDKNFKNIYLFKIDISSKIVPSIKNFNKSPILNDISGLCILFHSTQMVDWVPHRGGDYTFISELYNKYQPVWCDNILSRTQTKGNFGNAVDLKTKQISVNLASYPPRKKYLIECLKNLLTIDFIDVIRVCLNQYKDISSEFPKDKKIQYYINKNDLKDSGKFLWCGDIKNEYYFTIDDDLLYPESYFIEHLKSLQKHNNDIFVTLHGKEMKKYPESFNDNIKSYHCLKDVEEDVWVNNGGTGVMVFDNSKYTIPIDFFEYHGMADLWIGYYCQKNKISILCRKHESNELSYLLKDSDETLFGKRLELTKKHKKVLKIIGEWNLYEK